MAKDKQKELNTLKEDIIKPTYYGAMECLNKECLMVFGKATFNKKVYRLFYGVGKVCRVVKGEKQDLVYINFGIFSQHQTRLVVAFDNHTRRQTLTLKRGQMAQVVGICRNYMYEFEKDGVKQQGLRLGLYAYGFNGWYVPTMMDIRKMPTNEDLVEPSEKEEKLMKNFDDVLNEFLTGKGNEEDEE